MSVQPRGATTGAPWFLPYPEEFDRADVPFDIKALADRLAELLGGVGVPTGGSIDWWTTTPPPGFLLADGSAISRAAYPTLFAVLGTLHGAGDGVNTFNLPDTRGRVTVGLGVGPHNGAIGENDAVAANLRSVRHGHTNTIAFRDPGHVHQQRGMRGYFEQAGTIAGTYGWMIQRDWPPDAVQASSGVNTDGAGTGAWIEGTVGNDWGAGLYNAPSYIVCAKAIKT